MKKIYLLFIGSLLLGILTVKAQLYAPEIKVMQIVDNNVGIGVDNPQSKLHIKSGGSNALRFERDDSNVFGFEIGGTSFGLSNYTSSKYLWIAYGDNIGIGCNNPKSKLHIKSEESSITRFERDGSNVFGFEIGGTSFGLSNYTSSKYLWIAYGDNIGIGSNNPQSKLHIKSEGSNVLRFERDGCNAFGFEIAGAELGLVNYSNKGQYLWRALGLNLLLVQDVGNVGIGCIPNADYKLDVDGTIRANNYVGMVNNGADFVFEKGYNLQSLSEIEQFIKENKHLPEIVSAKEMKENGVNISEFQMKLLQKIEELTLYTIEQQKQIEELKKQNSQLQRQSEKIQDLQEKIEKIESASK